MSRQTCRLCNDSCLKEVLTITNSPRNISRMLRKSDFALDYPIPLHVFQCSACGHIQINEEIESSFYDDYIMTVSHSRQMQEYQKQQAIDFVAKFSLSGKNVIEVGCGDGNFLTYLSQSGVKVSGMEPSGKFRELAKKRGFKIFDGYMHRDCRIPGEVYVGFVTRQVLEHVRDPNDVLQGIRSVTTDSAVGLIEVPSVEQTIEQNRFYDFFPDHLSYFSSRTLKLLLEKNGFDVIEISRGMNGEYLVAHVKTSPVLNLDSLSNAKKIADSALSNFIDALVAGHKRIAFWGAGGKGVAVLAGIDVTHVACVVDSDSLKTNLFTPLSHLPIVDPKYLKTNPVDAIIITALAYRDEIIGQIQKDIGFKGIIAILSNDGLSVIQNNEAI
jgi:SAM-dependent methyltransferase